MTDAEIREMPAGRKMDALIAYHLFGWRWYEIQISNRCYFLPPEGSKWERFNYNTDAKQVEEVWPANQFADWDQRVWIDGEQGRLPDFSRDIAAAWEVVEYIKRTPIPSVWLLDPCVKVCLGDAAFCEIFDLAHCQGYIGQPKGERFDDICANAEDAPLAICRAALLWQARKSDAH